MNKTSVLNIIDCLKNRNTWNGTVSETYSGKLTIGIDKNLKTDADIKSSLNISEGATSTSILGYGGGTWTITLEWN